MNNFLLSCAIFLVVIAQSVIVNAAEPVVINIQSSTTYLQSTDIIFIRNITVQFQGNTYVCDVPFKWNVASYSFEISDGASCIAANASKKVRVHVSDSITSLPIQNAAVAVGTQQSTTDNDGNVYFSTLNPGDYSLIITATGYQSESVSFNLSTSNRNLNVALSK